MIKKVSISTLGCKVNKYESDCMANILKHNGYNVVSKLEKADYYIINTCAVTKESEKKSRQYIAKCLELNPKAKIIICGCASQNNFEQFSNKKNVFSMIGNEGKENILTLLKVPTTKLYDFDTKYNALHSPLVTNTRAYIKVQDGCNNFCSYCLIPYLRGRSRSRCIDDVVKEANSLSKTCKEIVITGIDMSSFKPSLDKLMEALKDVPARIRIGSLEVNVITHNLLKVLSGMNNFCPQFHLSLQSGNNRILKRMNRHYSTREYLKRVKLIRKYFPNANITTDIIVGFDMETEKEFNSTVKFARRVGFGKIHIFPYSKREGTLAYTFEDLPKEVKHNRVAILECVNEELEHKFFKKNLNCTYKVLTEDIEDEYVVGFTENYIKVYLPKDTLQNHIELVTLVGYHKDGMLGKLIN